MTTTQIKAAVRARDGMRCTKCGATNDEHKVRTGRQLEVHRVVPGSAYSTEPGVCRTLCRRCHGPEPRRPAGLRHQQDKGTTRNIAFPGPWGRLVKKLAARKRTRPSWLLVALASEAARKEGLADLPPLPWHAPGDES